ncbi:MAG: ABC transporter ATP-binding protein [Promethearchaeota archaeon]
MPKTSKTQTKDTPAIESFRLTKIYAPGVMAVNRLNLQIRQSVVHALVGPNGAGKTTTLKLLAGLIRPNRGSIFIMGFDLLRESWNAKQHIGFLSDQPAAYESLKVNEFLHFIGSLYKIPKDVFEQRRNKYMSLFDITSYQNKYLGELSRGMLQRTLLCGLLVHKPKVIMMDEPLYGLDPEGGYVLKQLIRDLASEGHTILISTHILSVAEEVSDEFTILSDGVKVASGTTKELRNQVGDETSLEQYYIETLRGG